MTQLNPHTPPKLHRRSYWVWMNTPATEDQPAAIAEAVAVEVTYADQLRGELEAAKHGISMAVQPMAIATIWVWCAMVRQGLYADLFMQFKSTDLAELQPITSSDELAELAGEAVPDPT